MKEKWQVDGPYEVHTDASRLGIGDKRKEWWILGRIGGRSGRTIASLGEWKDREHTEEDAREIVALHNAAIEIGDPLKVAEHIGAVVEAARHLQWGRYDGWTALAEALSQLEEK